MRATILCTLATALVAATASLGVPAANAAPISFAFQGTVDSVDPNLAGTFAPGATLTGTYSFESTTVARAGSNSNFAVFDALTGLSFSIDGYAASSSAASEIQVDNDPGLPNHDRYGLTSRASEGLTGPDVGDFELDAFLFRLDDSTDSVFSDALILPLALDFSAFDSSAFFLFFVNPSTAQLANVSGQLTAIAQVPEPSTVAMLGLGLVSLALIWRRRVSRRANATRTNCA